MTRGTLSLIALMLATCGTHAVAEPALTFQDAKVDVQPVVDETRRPVLSTPAADRKARAAFDLYADHAFASDLTDSAGELSVSRLGAGFQMIFPVLSDSQIGVALGAEHWNFDFKDATAFDSVDGDPWSGVNDLDLTLTFSNRINEQWSYVAGVFGRATYADGADIGESLTAGAIVGATYKVNDRFSIGGGVSLRSPLEDDFSVLPLVTIDWQISDKLALRSTPSVGRRLMALIYTPTEAFEIAFGAGIESIDFRLDDDAPASEGVGRFRRIPVGLDLTYNFSRQVSLNLYGGMVFAQELTLDDTNGERIEREAVDATPFLGGGFQWRF
jgi:hypothetical protein